MQENKLSNQKKQLAADEELRFDLEEDIKVETLTAADLQTKK